MFGAAGVGAVVLGACGSSNKGDGAQPATTSAGRGPTSTNGSAAGSGTSVAPATAAAGALSASSFKDAASCALTPQQTEGPYYIDVDQIRSDIREDRQGAPLRVGVRIMDADGCTPIKDAVFEIWHCDAGGAYSGFEAASAGAGGAPGGGPGGGASQTDATRYLRGAQVTNADGITEVTTVYPGWYQGRNVHIHAKVQLSNRDVLTTQLYFDDAVSDRVFTNPPYSAHTGRRTLNSADGIYRSETTMTVSADGDGYLGLITIGVSA